MGGGGAQRTTKFVRYLPDFGWEPVVLTVKDVLYHSRDASLLHELKGREIIRTGSWDPQRVGWKVQRIHRKKEEKLYEGSGISLLQKMNRRLLPWVLTPDPKVLWLPLVKREALQIINKKEIDCIFTTSPPQSDHLAGLWLRKKTGLPWVADFRDNWLSKQSESVPTPIHRKMNDGMSQRVVEQADRIVTVSDMITEDLHEKSGRQKRYFSTITNGYDKTDFNGIESRFRDKRFTITYCGALDVVRNPEVFLLGVARALENRPELRENLLVRFVGSVHGIDLKRMIQKHRLEAIAEHVKYVPHSTSIEHMMSSDMLLLLISEDTGAELVTGKIFEYLASGKPILAVVPGGEAEKFVLRHARGVVVPPDDAESIAAKLIRSFTLWKRGDLKVTVPRWKDIEKYERKGLTKALADIFNEVIAKSPR
jgi:glycosyltransferase involved in cell wall biosynthesis